MWRCRRETTRKPKHAFKSAVQAEADSTPVLTYLAACFAASGHDGEAASAWQTALIDGSDFPEIYQWLGDALMRSRDISPGAHHSRRSAVEVAVRRPFRQAAGA